MTGPGCHSGRKHTPIVSEKQRVLFRMVAAGVKTKAKSLSQKEAKEHLAEVKGKRLVRVAAKRKKG